MRFLMLGALDVQVGGLSVPLGSAKQRLLLTALLLAPNEVHRTGDLADLVWDDDKPASAPANLRTYAHRLRQTLHDESGGPSRLVSRGGGYLLRVEPGERDLDGFDQAAQRGRQAPLAGDSAAAELWLGRALEVWQNRLLAGLVLPRELARRVAYLEEQRLLVEDDYVQAHLDRGAATEMIGRLRQRVEQHPLREGSWRQLMSALYQSGDAVGAVTAYLAARQTLADRTGLDPHPRLQALYQDILHHNPELAKADPRPGESGPGVEPAQLPADVAAFAGRLRELDQLGELCKPSAPSACVITGMSGVGKTALAVHWAHQVKEQFPDGQLYIDLRGYAAEPPRTPLDALTQFLRALGVPSTQVPMDTDEAAALFRTMLAHRRLLILLDNARTADQVRSLLPGGSGCRVLITSRDRLTGLVARDNAQRVSLRPFSPVEAVGLLRSVLDDPGRHASAELSRLAEACGHLPLALRIAAAKLADHPDEDLTGYLDQLTSQGPLRQLAVDDDGQASMAAAFEASYRALTGAAQRIFRLLGTTPGGDVTAYSTAAMAGIDAAEASRLLGVLVNAHLAEPRGRDRYGLHDLLREYARELADAASERPDAVARLCDFYLATINNAAAKLYAHTIRLPEGAAHRSDDALDLADAGAARRWLDEELPSVTALIGHCAQAGPAPMTWLLTDALRGYLWIRRPVAEWLHAATLGLATAEAHGQHAAVAAMHLGLGQACRAVGQLSEADEHLRHAIDAAGRSGWDDVRASALTQLAVAYAGSGASRDAERLLGQALEIYGRTGRRSSEAVVLTNLGTLHYLLGDIRQSVVFGQRALDLYRQTDNPSGRATALCNLGINLALLGETEAARVHLVEGMRIAVDLQDPLSQALGEQGLAQVAAQEGQAVAAVRHADAAIEHARLAGDTGHLVRCAVEAAVLRIDLGERSDDAAAELDRLHREATAAGNAHTAAVALIGLGRTHLRDGRYADAAEKLRQAVQLAQQWQYELVEAEALDVLAVLARAEGHHDHACDLAEQAADRMAKCGLLPARHSRFILGRNV
ncbi:DNA-binding SARP family transcriptional activator/Arc/MetJ-type ribon-helix-helix transcriptional regulator [Hamadaea flava]|uniref:BTAD domain-containing putative transcriptional regulator n=1 Tax=Hamadaea flava TaxID=1742688 RepID=A0ABV8LMR2_9ACTN|nr:BTAD domain-containing putative transcriptional regulator [Hamadaea flava]MCP2324015.1 DNA-binding SARP family transcriptional activator/Arc/MetJ-type ribon-helix-helix transcriptional regulator [Hamadaea flava]